MMRRMALLRLGSCTRIPSLFYSTQTKTHFGYEEVEETEKQEKVQSVFTRVAHNYDLMNDAMSGGAHRLWKDYFMFRLAPSHSTKLIDVAGGTGDIAFRFLKHLRYLSKDDFSGFEAFSDLDAQLMSPLRPGGHVTVVDLNQGMLDVGQDRANDLNYNQEVMNWVCANAEDLPFEDNSFDAFTIAFGIRNCTHIEQVLKEAHRVLNPGGRFMCLEFSAPTSTILSKLYDTYSMQVIPVMGHVIAGDYHAYQYLVQSIRKFRDQETFKCMIESAGFRHVTYENLSRGIVAIHSGYKL